MLHQGTHALRLLQLMINWNGLSAVTRASFTKLLLSRSAKEEEDESDPGWNLCTLSKLKTFKGQYVRYDKYGKIFQCTT